MPRARAKKVDGSVTTPGSSLPRKAVDESVDAPDLEASERANLVDDSAQNSVAGTKASDNGIPDVKMPDVIVAKVTINAPDAPKTSSCCYCCCVETGLYWEYVFAPAAHARPVRSSQRDNSLPHTDC